MYLCAVLRRAQISQNLMNMMIFGIDPVAEIEVFEHIIEERGGVVGKLLALNCLPDL